MKKALFYTFLFVFASTVVITLLGIVNILPIEKGYLEKLFYALLVESTASIIALFKKTEFFSEEAIKNRMNVVMIPKELFSKSGDPHQCTISIYNKETDDEKELNVSLKRENGYLCAYLDRIDYDELIKVSIKNADNDGWESQYFSPHIAKAEMEEV